MFQAVLRVRSMKGGFFVALGQQLPDQVKQCFIFGVRQFGKNGFNLKFSEACAVRVPVAIEEKLVCKGEHIRKSKRFAALPVTAGAFSFTVVFISKSSFRYVFGQGMPLPM
jgi:hypothetical protein